MKNIIFLTLLALAFRCGAQVSNFDATVDTNWPTIVIPKLNYNNGWIVSSLNTNLASNNATAFGLAQLRTNLTIGGVYSPTNTWNINTATNGLHNGDWRANLNSNGFLVDVGWSNNAPVYLTHH